MSGALARLDRERLGWWALAVLLVGVLAAAASAAIGGVCLGVAAYYAVRPVHRSVRWLVRFESLAALGALAALVLPVLGMVAALAGLTAREFALARWLTDRYEHAEGFLRHLASLADRPLVLFSGPELDAIADGAETGLALAGTVGTVALNLFVACVIAFYLLRDDRRLRRWATDRFGREERPNAAPNAGSAATGADRDRLPSDRRVLLAYCRRVDRDLEAISFGAAAGAIVTGAVGVLAYGLLGALAPAELGAPYLQVGFAVGVGGLVPLVGRKLVYLSITVALASVAVVEGSGALWFVLLFFGASLVVVEAGSDRLLWTYGVDPRRYGGRVALACVLGALAVGWYGLLLGPFVLVSTVQFARVVAPTLLGTRRALPVDGPPPNSPSPAPKAERSPNPRSVDPPDRERDGVPVQSGNPPSDGGGRTPADER